MRDYKIIFCFLNKDGFIESDKFGEVYHSKVVTAYNKGEAVERLKVEEKFLVQPEIVAVEEVKNERIRNV